MSVHQYKTKGGETKWRVRWRDGSGKLKSRSFDAKKPAEAFDAEITYKKSAGAALPQSGRKTLGTVWEKWEQLTARSLAENTRRTYKAMWAKHIEPELGDTPLSQLADQPIIFDEFIAAMADRGVGPEAQRKSFVVLSALLTQAVDWNWIAANPLWKRKKPLPPSHRRQAKRIAPISIETIREQMKQRKAAPGSHAPERDALIVSLLAYAGLRPQEALALTWEDITPSTIRINKAVSFGEKKNPKTKDRDAPLVPPLRDDLTAWRKTLGDPADDKLLFEAPDGGYWSASAWRNWRTRIWKTAVEGVVGGDPSLSPLEGARPYDLRGSCVSLRLRAGEPTLEIARSTGHSPRVMFDHYASVIEELRDEPVTSVEDQIIRARRLISEKSASEVRELVEETLKEPASSGRNLQAQSLLYGRRPIKRTQ